MREWQQKLKVIIEQNKKWKWWILCKQKRLIKKKGI
jgi:hypothetical protein